MTTTTEVVPTTTTGVTTLPTTNTSTNLTTAATTTLSSSPSSSSTTPETTTKTTQTTNTTENRISFTTTAANTTSYVYTESTDSDQDGMEPGVIGGVVAGVVVAIFVVALLIFLYRRRRKRPKPTIPKLPSASDVDKTIHKLRSHDTPETTDLDNVQVDPESLYRNVDADGNPTDRTNPHVGDDGYLKKEEKKKTEKKKKKLRNKFDKKKAKPNQDSAIDLGVQNINKSTERTVSDASYSHALSPDMVESTYDTGKVKDESFYVNTTDNIKGYANLEGIKGDKDTTNVGYYNMHNNQGPTEIYENP